MHKKREKREDFLVLYLCFKRRNWDDIIERGPQSSMTITGENSLDISSKELMQLQMDDGWERLRGLLP